MPERVELSTTNVRTDDWPAQATDSIVKVVGTVHDKVTGPITTIARGVVFGTMASILGMIAVILFGIMAVRVLDNYLPDAVFGENHVWAAYLIVGLVLCAVALVLWTRRVPSQSKA
jgi:uncharacterized BrkB/YihY/UPF0761 family membrane protein